MNRRSESTRSSSLCIALALAVLVAVPAVAGEWTSWRGDAFNGASDETGLPESWSPEGDNVCWHQPFVGRSTPVVVDGRTCVIGRRGDGATRQEVVACFDADTGARLWEHAYNVYNTTVPFNRVGWASLAADPATGVVYSNGVGGELRAWAPDGTVLWRHFMTEWIGYASGYGGRTQSPIVDGDQLLIGFVSSNWGKHAAPRHRYFSFDKASGDLLWISQPGERMVYDMNTQSVPVVATIGDTRMLIGGNADGHIYALKAGTGEMVWKFELSRRGINSSVIVDGTTVYASHSEENIDDPYMGRMVAIDATGSGDVTKTHERWRINQFGGGFPSPTIHDGTIYHVDNAANLHAIDAASGKVLWTHELGTVGKSSPVWADGKLYVPETNGRFHILKVDTKGATTLDVDEVEVEGGRYAEIYASPAIADGRVYLSTEAGVYCIGEAGGGSEPAASKKGKARRSKKNKKSKGAAAKAALAGLTSIVDTAKQATGDVAVVRVAPAETLIAPGDAVQFTAFVHDARGERLGIGKASWSLDGLVGSIDGGRFTPKGDGPQAGHVVAKVGSVSHAARVRVVPPLPWHEDFESYEVDAVPATWVGAAGKWKVQELDGNKVLTKLFRSRGLLRNLTFMGPSDWTDYTIQADVRGSKKGRRRTDMSIIGAGYTLDLQGVQQRLQLRSWPSEERIAKEVDFAWDPDAWYTMKLTVDTSSGTGVIRGKVWPQGAAEPEGWTIEVIDPLPIAGGSPGLVSYSPADCYYDNIKVMVNP